MKNILSIDVEESWAGEFARNRITKKEYYTDQSIPKIIDVLNNYGAKATFFCVSDSVSDESLDLISSSGNEVAFHTKDHLPLWEKDPKEFLRDLFDFQDRVHLAARANCIGFRAPSFSKTNWMMDALFRADYKYDSSVFPSANFLYGSFRSPTVPFYKEGVWEFPITVGDMRHPFGGGFYWRLFPDFYILSELNETETWQNLVLYVHSWELFPSPKLEGLSFFGNFYCNHNIEKTLGLLRKVLEKFSFTTFKDVLNEKQILTELV